MVQSSAAARAAASGAPVRLVPLEVLQSDARDLVDRIARRAYEIYESRGYTHGQDVEDWRLAESELVHPCALELLETNDAITIFGQVPGFQCEQLEVCVEPRRFTLFGRREVPAERKAGDAAATESLAHFVSRIFDLSSEVDPAKASAEMGEGILEVRMPKGVPQSESVSTGQAA